MRDRLLGLAEVCAWVAASFTGFLALRVALIFLNLLDAAQCTDSCEAGAQAVPIALFTFGLGWFPFVLVGFVRAAKRRPERWWLPHSVVVVAAHAVALVILAGIFGQYPDADPRTSLLAYSAGAFDVVTLGLLLTGSDLKRRNL